MGSEEILMCSLLLHSSIPVTKRSLQRRICAVVIFCPRKVVVTNW